MFCNKCGYELLENAKFCRKCGNKLKTEEPEKRKCPSCGASCEKDDIFCEECGTKLINADSDIPNIMNGFEQNVWMCAKCGKIMPNGTDICECGESKLSHKSSLLTEESYSMSEPMSGPVSDKPERVGKLFKSVFVALYEGRVTNGLQKQSWDSISGNIFVYDDHISFNGKVSINPTKMFKKKEEFKLSIDDMAGIEYSHFDKVCPSMIITLKNGNQYTFVAGVIYNSAIVEVVRYIQKQI